MEAAIDDIDFITDDIQSIKELKKAHTRTVSKKTIKIRSSVDKAKSDYKTAKQLHRNNIKSLHRNIRTHKLMIKQARNTYRLVKLSK